MQEGEPTGVKAHHEDGLRFRIARGPGVDVAPLFRLQGPASFVVQQGGHHNAYRQAWAYAVRALCTRENEVSRGEQAVITAIDSGKAA